MRRIRHYGNEHYDDEPDYKVPPRLPYFLYNKLDNAYSNTHHHQSSIKYRSNESNALSSDQKHYSNTFFPIPPSSDNIADEDDNDYIGTGVNRQELSRRYDDSQSEDGYDYDQVYEVVSDGCLATSHTKDRALRLGLSNHDMRDDRKIKVNQKRTPAKKIVCKFCATSKQFGNCPCPIHLPTVQSRYMRVLQDNSRNAITINVFKNGDYRVTPTMIHIPKFHMRSMEEIMKIVDKFIRFPVGYAYALYTILGDLVEDPRELEPYEMYVVVNNCKKQFVPLEYGSKRPPSMNTGRRRRTICQSTFALAPFHIRRG